MTIDQFVTGSPAQILAFKEAYIRHAAGDDTFVGERTELDWWREILAYLEYSELEEQFQRAGSN